MINVSRESDKIKTIMITYSRLQDSLYQDLSTEFEDDLIVWNAIIDRPTLSVRFQSPEILFTQGSDTVNQVFKNILNDFFPRFTKIITSNKYREDIEEIRIEGHTSSEWGNNCTDDETYFNNMQLSQNRTRSVLQYVLCLKEVDSNRDWLKSRLTANGLSSSKLILADQGQEDFERSRRVEFRVRTNAEQRIAKVIQELSK
ncbi:MAG: OmpA family protein [bacterium]|nr:OmpA family protein [bacterium]